MFRILYRFLASLAHLAVRSGRSKDLEIIALRHQITVLQRHGDPLQLNHDDRTVLGAIASALPRPLRIGWIVTPETLLRWHRQRIARKLAAGQPWTPIQPTTRTPIHRRRDPQAHHRHGQPQPNLGLTPHPRRTHPSRPPGRGIHRVENPQTPRHRPRTQPIHNHVNPIPAIPGRSRLRLRHCRHRVPAPLLPPVLHRRHHPRSLLRRHHRQPDRRIGPPKQPATYSSATPTTSPAHEPSFVIGAANSSTASTRSSEPKASRSSKPCGCLIKTVGVRCGVCVALKGSGRLAL